ncbi:MAG: hypothetical protein KAT65_19415 [Methanophagales archaeon]|nr:hypothetical protein [Methanophagales archaeon]
MFLVKVFTEGKKVVGKSFFSNGRFDGKNTSQQTFKKSLTSKSVGRENALHVRAYLLILLVLIPQFMCTTGTMYEIFDVPREITLSTEGMQYDQLYIHDHWLIAREWLSSSEVVGGRLVNKQKTIGNMTEYLGMFAEKSRIYDNGGSEVWE